MKSHGSKMDKMSGDLNWNDMKILLAVYRLKSASLAAVELGVSHQTISRRISALEKSLGVRLIDRNGKFWQLTTRAKSIASQAEIMESAMFLAEQKARVQSNEMTGRIKITTHNVAFQWLLLPIISKIKKQFPFIQFDFLSENTLIDLSMGEADIALRFTQKPNQQLVGRCVSPIPFHLYGKKHFIHEFESAVRDKNYVDLPIIELALQGKSFKQWQENIISPGCHIHSANDLSVVISAISAGLGIGYLPRLIGRQIPHLLESNFAPVYTPFDLWLLTNEDAKHSLKIKRIYHILFHKLQEALKNSL